MGIDKRNLSIISGLVLILLLNGSALPAIVAAQSNRDSETFTLVLYGSQLTANELQISLKENPGLKNRWIRLQDLAGKEKIDIISAPKQLFIAKGLSADRFVGQDIRENYIALRIVSLLNPDSPQEAALRGAWAFHSLDIDDKKIAKQLLDRIINEPIALQRESFASLVYPKDKKIKAGDPLIDHIELPVRHYKPGVREVQWLQLLFSR